MKFEKIAKLNYDIVFSKVEKIDASNASELKDLLTKLQNDSRNRIIIDLSNTAYCDSSGLSALLFGHRYCKNTNGRFIISGLQPMVKKLINIAQLDKIISISEDRENAEEEINLN